MNRSISEIVARELDLSAKTVLRVIDNSPQVSAKTRIRVIAALNDHGYFTSRLPSRQTILFDFRTTDFAARLIIPIMQRLSHKSYNSVVSDHTAHFAKFENLVAESSIVVWGRPPERKTIEWAQTVNPDALHICLLSGGGGYISIDSDDYSGGRMAAEYLYSKGHRDILVFSASEHPNARERIIGFLGQLKLTDPLAKCEIIEYQDGNTSEVVYARLQAGNIPSAIFCSQRVAAEYSAIYFKAHAIRIPEDVSILTYDRPEYEVYSAQIQFDYIYYNLEDMINWTEYYILNRPLTNCRKNIRVLIPPDFMEFGSVITITE